MTAREPTGLSPIAASRSATPPRSVTSATGLSPTALSALVARQRGRARLRAATIAFGAAGLVAAGAVAYHLPGATGAGTSTAAGAAAGSGSSGTVHTTSGGPGVVATTTGRGGSAAPSAGTGRAHAVSEGS
jgi:hypothetical protein